MSRRGEKGRNDAALYIDDRMKEGLEGIRAKISRSEST
jgi:hypothetical protein